MRESRRGRGMRRREEEKKKREGERIRRTGWKKAGDGRWKAD